jgi:hypothetical protein
MMQSFLQHARGARRVDKKEEQLKFWTAKPAHSSLWRQFD